MMDWMNEWVIGGLTAVGVVAMMVAFVAWQRGKNAGLWLLLSLLLTPILSLLLLLRITRPKVTQDDSHLWVEFESDSPDLGLKCSACRIPIRTYTRVCFHCGSERDPSILEDGPHRQWCNGVAEEKPQAVSPALEPAVPSAG